METPGLPEPEPPFLVGAGAVFFGPAQSPAPYSYSSVNILFLRDPKYEYMAMAMPMGRGRGKEPEPELVWSGNRSRKFQK